MKSLRALAALFLCLSVSCLSALAQFDLEESHTTASLRGIDALGAGVAWASGADGAILRTEDGGYLWQPCTVPKGAEKLDFRGIQGFDANTAVVMASGKGELSRIYKTTDGCQTWKLVFTNPDADGFFDALRKVTANQMYLMGDPVHGNFAMFFSPNRGNTWFIADDPGLESEKGDGGFAASNSAFTSAGPFLMFGTAATSMSPPKAYYTRPRCPPPAPQPKPDPVACSLEWVKTEVPMGSGASTMGIFSLAARTASDTGGARMIAVAVGGNYEKPDQTIDTAAYTTDGGAHWHPAVSTPGGYRSGVAFDRPTGFWIAVGPNGTDISRDLGRSWTEVKPQVGEAADTDRNWNAISLPFVVGPHGRIGKIRAGVLKK